MTSRDATAPELQRAARPEDRVAPRTEEELSEILAAATEEGRRVSVWGGGTHRDMGYATESDLAISTTRLSGIVDWEPDDLTVVVKAGTPLAELEQELQAGGQSAILPEQPGAATIGGVVATGVSPYARLRYGPTRDRMLEVQAVTGDGRIVKGGGRVVKNVTGYDLPRLYTGSFGSLGVITSVCLKLWPLSEATATVRLPELPPDRLVHRPRAVLETPDGVRVLLSGTGPEVEDQVRRLGGEAASGFDYPPPVHGPLVWSLRVRPGSLAEALTHLPAHTDFVAQHGVGEVTFATDPAFDIDLLRDWAEREEGSVVRLRGTSPADPWGSPPPALEIQRRIIAAFDPRRILEAGRLPGRM